MNESKLVLAAKKATNHNQPLLLSEAWLKENIYDVSLDAFANE